MASPLRLASKPSPKSLTHVTWLPDNHHVDNMVRPELDSPDTLLGQLQRGRGAGYLWALEEKKERVHQHLVVCITDDPRYDRQLESRSFFYADLGLTIGLDIRLLAEHLERHDERDLQGWSAELTIYTLGALASRGMHEAVAILRDYVDRGFWWGHALDELKELGEPEAVESLLQVVERRIRGEESLTEKFFGAFVEDFPWSDWRERSEVVAEALRAVDAVRRPVPAFETMETEEILQRVDRVHWVSAGRVLAGRRGEDDVHAIVAAARSGAPASRVAALSALARLQHPETIDLALAALRGDDPSRFIQSRAIRALKSLPPDQMLEHARWWLDADEWAVRKAGGSYLADHAVPEDAERLRSALHNALARGNEDGAWTYVRGLRRLRGLGPFPEIEEYFERTPSSRGRLAAAEALAATSQEFPMNYARECLWDCEEDTQLVGCRLVDLSLPGVVGRLKELAGDPVTDDELKAEIRQRLA
jgi:HEAT repeat protein